MELSASADEAAAIAAAVELFLAETTPRAAAADTVDPWTRAALLEGVGAQRVTTKDLEGGMR
jgi:hypothetical protein